MTSDLIQLTAVQGPGTGVGDQTIGLLSTGKSEFAVSVESAVRNLGDNLIHQIYGNYDIRTFAEEYQ